MKLRSLVCISVLLLVAITALAAQEADPNQDDSFFDPFAESSSDSSTTEDPFFDPFAADSSSESLEPAFEDDLFADNSDSSDIFNDSDIFSGGAAEADIFADDFSITDDFDSLFLADTGITEIDTTLSVDDTSSYEDFLVSEALTWGGSYSGSLNMSWDWENYVNGIDVDDVESSLSPSASTSLYFDARPESDYRVFGKLFIETQSSGFDLAGIDLSNLQVANNNDGSIGISLPGNDDEDEEEESDPSALSLTIGIQELFSDFQYDDSIFFRFGKSFVKWGVGYFFSPADVVNLDSIDAEDPTADRQGPLNFRIHIPDGINNTYVYVLTDQVDSPDDISYALKREIVAGNSEIGLGGYLSFKKAPRVIATISTAIDEVKVFGEGVVSFGSDRVFVAVSKNQPEFDDDTEDADTYTALDTFTFDSLPFFSGTLGFMYNHTDPDLMMIGQYYFNGEGYDYLETDYGKTLLDSATYLLLNADTNGLAVPDDQQPDDYQDPPALSVTDIQNFGRHYGAFMLSMSNIADTDLSLSMLWLGNLSDGSGLLIPSLSWKIIDRISVNAGVRMTYGRSGTEYADPAGLFAQNPQDNPQEPTFSITCDLSIGGGSF